MVKIALWLFLVPGVLFGFVNENKFFYNNTLESLSLGSPKLFNIGVDQSDDDVGLNYAYSNLNYSLGSFSLDPSFYFSNYQEIYSNYSVGSNISYQFRNFYSLQFGFGGSLENSILRLSDFESKRKDISALFFIKANFANLFTIKTFTAALVPKIIKPYIVLEGAFSFKESELSLQYLRFLGEHSFRLQYQFNFSKSVGTSVSYDNFLRSISFAISFSNNILSGKYNRKSLKGSGRNALTLSINKSTETDHKTLSNNDEEPSAEPSALHKKKEPPVHKTKEKKSRYRFLSFPLLLRWGLQPKTAFELSQVKNDEAKFELMVRNLESNQFQTLASNLQRIYRKASTLKKMRLRFLVSFILLNTWLYSENKYDNSLSFLAAQPASQNPINSKNLKDENNPFMWGLMYNYFSNNLLVHYLFQSKTDERTGNFKNVTHQKTKLIRLAMLFDNTTTAAGLANSNLPLPSSIFLAADSKLWPYGQDLKPLTNESEPLHGIFEKRYLSYGMGAYYVSYTDLNIYNFYLLPYNKGDFFSSKY